MFAKKTFLNGSSCIVLQNDPLFNGSFCLKYGITLKVTEISLHITICTLFLNTITDISKEKMELLLGTICCLAYEI
jgi:hypothetical protein